VDRDCEIINSIKQLLKSSEKSLPEDEIRLFMDDDQLDSCESLQMAFSQSDDLQLVFFLDSSKKKKSLINHELTLPMLIPWMNERLSCMDSLMDPL